MVATEIRAHRDASQFAHPVWWALSGMIASVVDMDY